MRKKPISYVALVAYATCAALPAAACATNAPEVVVNRTKVTTPVSMSAQTSETRS